MSEQVERVIRKYARELSSREFETLMRWLGPKAYTAHKQYPEGRRYFDTRTRVFAFNISPEDYLAYDIDTARRMMDGGAKLRDVVNPRAYAAMRDVIGELKKRNVKFRLEKRAWTKGGSFIVAKLPEPKSK
jgi:hypothetical protein